MLNHSVTVCLGSNINDMCHAEVQAALKWLAVALTNMKSTTPYFTTPEGTDAGKSPYLNAVAEGESTLSANELTLLFKNYERDRGRRPEHKRQNHIIIDIDLVCYDGQIVNLEEFNADYFTAGYKSLNDERHLLPHQF